MLEIVSVSDRIIDWYLNNARELPWRQEEVSAWGILVSEFMLQQTQVERVFHQWIAWMDRWPTPEDLAEAPVNEVIVAWGRLGYPRRALWLHQAAKRIVSEFGGIVPEKVDDLLSLKGVGDYTARAVAVFAHRQRHPVLDTNVRRVLARVRDGQAQPAPPNWARDLVEAENFLPEDPKQARIFSYGIMEFGAVICTSRAPKCHECRLRQVCSWARQGFPEYRGPQVPQQARFAGSDREVRGKILAKLREFPHDSFSAEDLLTETPDQIQGQRALASLVRDSLIQEVQNGEIRYRLPQ